MSAIQSANTVSNEDIDSAPESRAARLSRIGFSLAIALAIVIAAWFVGGRAGFEEIGRGGINQQVLPRVGEEAPNFIAYNVDTGQVVSLSDYQGQPIWLNFWGSWCPPCRAEMPDIQAAYEQLEPDGLALLAVSLWETPGQAAEFAALNGATFTILSDQYSRGSGEHYPIANFPTHIFIDRDGIIRSVVLSDMDVKTAVAQGRAVLDAT